mmetsp:Transcript_36879/g.114798  ORF Transcript_36879/g.114798 Transcript_36879/m.114798 type:complete len:220 (+) Transcript_36879:124-783(+)
MGGGGGGPLHVSVLQRPGRLPSHFQPKSIFVRISFEAWSIESLHGVAVGVAGGSYSGKRGVVGSFGAVVASTRLNSLSMKWTSSQNLSCESASTSNSTTSIGILGVVNNPKSFRRKSNRRLSCLSVSLSIFAWRSAFCSSDTPASKPEPDEGSPGQAGGPASGSPCSGALLRAGACGALALSLADTFAFVFLTSERSSTSSPHAGPRCSGPNWGQAARG